MYANIQKATDALTSKSTWIPRQDIQVNSNLNAINDFIKLPISITNNVKFKYSANYNGYYLLICPIIDWVSKHQAKT